MTRTNFLLTVFACLPLVLVQTGTALGGLITSNPGGGTTTTFTVTGNNGFGNPGPVVLDGITVTGNPQATYGNATYFIGGNGSWSSPSFPWVATNNSTGTVTFDLGGPASFVGGFINYYTPNIGNPPTIEALDAGMNVLESYNLALTAPISTPSATNAGAFRGIQRTQGDIEYFRIGGSYILTHDLTIGAAQEVPEPASLTLWSLGMSLAGIAAWRRRKLANTVAA